MFKTTLLFFFTALAEIMGCFLPYLWLRKGGSILLLLPPRPVWHCLSGCLPYILRPADAFMPLMAGYMS